VVTQHCPEAVANLSIGAVPRDGTGNSNGHWVRTTALGVELGIRAEERKVGVITPSNDGIAVYTTTACPSKGISALDPKLARWNFGISVDLRGGTGFYSGKNLNDFNVTLTIAILAGSIGATGFPLVLDVTQSFGVGLIADICSTCGLPSDFEINGQLVGPGPVLAGNNTACAAIANKFVDQFNFIQESSNIMFLPNITAGLTFNYTAPALLQLTLALAPKAGSGCSGPRCSLSASMVVSVQAVTCPAPGS